jgi:hypothetical protein
MGQDAKSADDLRREYPAHNVLVNAYPRKTCDTMGTPHTTLFCTAYLLDACHPSPPRPRAPDRWRGRVLDLKPMGRCGPSGTARAEALGHDAYRMPA